MDKLSIFSSINVGPYLLKNRLVALPVYTGYAHPDGTVSSLMIEHYSAIAKSGVAMVVVANAAVTLDGIVSSYNLRIDKDEFIPGLSKLVQAIKAGGSVSCLQLNHAGRFAKTDCPLLPSPVDKSHIVYNVSSLKNFMNFFPLEKRFGLTRYFLKQIKTWRRGMTTEDKERIIFSFGEASVRASEAGFDMIELHGAGGYLLCQFLSAFTHKNRFGQGADFEERTAFPLAVVRAIRHRLPQYFPLGYRLTIQEWVPDGINLSEALAFAKRLEREGVAYLSASVATYNSRFSSEAIKQTVRPAYLRKDMTVITRKVNIPTIISGRIVSPTLANEIIRNGSADIIGLGRSLRADMNWVNKAMNRGEKITPCIDCKWCIKRVVLDEGFACRRWSKLQQERIGLEHKLLSRNYRSLFVVADLFDMKLLQASLPFISTEKSSISTDASPTILFLISGRKDRAFHKLRNDFLKSIKRWLDQLGFTDVEVNSVVRVVRDTHDAEIHLEIERSNHGVIYLCQNRGQIWRERLIYKERGRIVALIGSGHRKSEVMVPVDLSDRTLLVLMFLRQAYIDKPGFDFHFIHVLTGSSREAEQRWKEIIKMVGFEEDFSLQLIHTKGDISGELLKTMRNENYGTIMMAKRGLSGIKRRMLGSVSSGLLKGLTDQSFFLID